MLATTPSGSCEMASSMEVSFETLRGRSVFLVSARKKSSRGKRPFSSLRDCAMGLPTSVVRMVERSSVRSITSSRNLAIVARRLASGTVAHAGCAARARSYFALTLFASSAGSVWTTFPVAGLVTLSIIYFVTPAVFFVTPAKAGAT